MPLSFVVVKLLMLRWLLACISCVDGYEFGYHPSAEEFDSVLREHRRTWTRDILANQRLDSWLSSTTKRSPYINIGGLLGSSPSTTTFGTAFVPKYNVENERTRYKLYHSQLWPTGDVDDLSQQMTLPPEKLSIDQATSNSVISSNTLPEEATGNVFSSATTKTGQRPYNKHNNRLNKTQLGTIIGTKTNAESISFATRRKKDKVTRLSNEKLNTLMPTHLHTPAPSQPIKHPILAPSGTVIQINHNFPVPLRSTKKIKKKNRDPQLQSTSTNDDQLPIFFTNPTTGIVYAITEVGKVPDANVAGYNGSIPIYITKEQYDRDIRLLQQRFEQTCSNVGSTIPSLNSQNPQNIVSSFSTSVKGLNTTEKPQIIHLQQKPSFSTRKPVNISKLPITDVSIGLRPVDFAGVSGHIGVIISTTPMPIKPTRRSKRKKSKKRANKKGPSGRITTKKPFATTKVPQNISPNFVKGLRPQRTENIKRLSTSTTTDRFATQLEKPNEPATIFSNSPFVSKRGFMSDITSSLSELPHRRKRRSVNLQNDKVISFQTQSYGNARRNNGSKYKVKKRTRQSGTGGKPTIKNKRSPVQRVAPAIFLAHRGQEDNRTHPVNGSILYSETSFNRQDTRNVYTENGSSRGSSKVRKSNKDDYDDWDFDILDFIVDLAEGEKYNDEIDNDHYDYKESNFDDKNSLLIKSTSVKWKNTSKPAINSSNERSTEQTVDDLHEDTAQGNSSSAEEGVDVGALEEQVSSTATNLVQEVLDEPIIEVQKDSVNKKRIKRRPSSADLYSSQEDYYDDDDNDVGVGSFFRMLFYPVQLAMSRIFDITEIDSHEIEATGSSTKYPTYTLYNNGYSEIGAGTTSVKDDKETANEQTNFFSEWFTSLFGFNRRTKNIGSSTDIPPVALVSQVALSESDASTPVGGSSWWDWLGFGEGSSPQSTINESNSDEHDDKWFFGWFDTKPKVRRRASTTTTTSTSIPPPGSMPQMPILTIVDPLRNPQNWIGILAHHLANNTHNGAASSTHNSLMEVFTPPTAKPIVDLDVPRYISYDKYQIWRLRPLDDGQVKILERFKGSEEGVQLQWLKGPSLRGLTDVLVPPRKIVDFRSTLNFETIAYEIMIFDVGKAIAYERAKEAVHLSSYTKSNGNNRTSPSQLVSQMKLPMSWHQYHSYDDIIKYLETIRIRHPQIVELIHIGRSYEGRPLVVVKLENQKHTSVAATANGGVDSQWVGHRKLKYKRQSDHTNAVFVESGAHGLEWIGPATTTWIINELLRIMKNNKTGEQYDFIRKTTWYIMPVLNPDGYVYTHEYDRFWRKTRSRHISRPNGIIDSAMNWFQQKTKEKVCFGVDLDRNWHYQWGKRGSSKSPCNEFFAGPQPFSEPETKALSDFLIDHRKQIKLYVSLQAYGQIISFPVRANTTFNDERMEDFLDVAVVGTNGLRKKGSKARYKVDATSDMNDQRSGSGDAFATYEVGVPFSYTIQLADNGVHGYLLPGSSIEPTARDAFEIITAMLDYI